MHGYQRGLLIGCVDMPDLCQLGLLTDFIGLYCSHTLCAWWYCVSRLQAMSSAAVVVFLQAGSNRSTV